MTLSVSQLFSSSIQRSWHVLSPKMPNAPTLSFSSFEPFQPTMKFRGSSSARERCMQQNPMGIWTCNASAQTFPTLSLGPFSTFPLHHYASICCAHSALLYCAWISNGSATDPKCQGMHFAAREFFRDYNVQNNKAKKSAGTSVVAHLSLSSRSESSANQDRVTTVEFQTDHLP